jgi:hypothetical protein
MRRHHGIGLVAAVTVLATGLTGAAFAGTRPVDAPSTTASPACPLDQILRPTCPGQALFGGWAKGYTAGTFQSQVEATEQRYGRRLDVVHSYHAPGNSSIPFGTDKWGVGERHFTQDEGRVVLANFKPGPDFAAAAAGDYDDVIRAAARNIKAVGPHKVMLALYHEPENDISGGTDCTGLRGDVPGNTPAAYRAMWRHARDVFDMEGVDNVVWVMNYISLPQWDCLVDEVWPGDDLVDWVAYDPYSIDGTISRVTRFADLLTAHSAASAHPGLDYPATHRYTDKPWMLAEYGVQVKAKDQAKARVFYDDLGALLDARTVGNLRALLVFDSQSGANAINLGVGVDPAGVPDPDEQAAFNRLAENPAFATGVVD